MIQELEDMIRRFCAYCLELKGSYGFNCHWCTLISALKLAYKTSIHSSTGKTPVMLEKGLNQRFTLYKSNSKQFQNNPGKKDIMQTDVSRILLDMQNEDGTKVISHIILK
ncbi:hypothetical protein O181_009180 [Austropuccinia psidii MF-1]|uniref:Uncharacterized protein n=1 Tax=Austropuccinia psidii MF-1 TaxID=1389203 RepID=A0A9Q3GJN0_9BASI|nr:hypothetical protein [Austropuccinia psidii MF-1]